MLDGPLYSDQYNTVTTVYNVPVLNDETDLSWHEANAGLADRFEVRFYSGSTLVATKVLTAKPGYALPHDLKPDDSLIATLTQGVSGRVGKIVNVNVPPSQPPSSVNWDLTWQVVGLHTFYDSCASASGAVGPNGRASRARDARNRQGARGRALGSGADQAAADRRPAARSPGCAHGSDLQQRAGRRAAGFQVPPAAQRRNARVGLAGPEQPDEPVACRTSTASRRPTGRRRPRTTPTTTGSSGERSISRLRRGRWRPRVRCRADRQKVRS